MCEQNSSYVINLELCIILQTIKFHMPLSIWFFLASGNSNSVIDKMSNLVSYKPNSDCILQMQTYALRKKKIMLFYLGIEFEKVWSDRNLNKTTRWSPASWTYQKCQKLKDNDIFKLVLPWWPAWLILVAFAWAIFPLFFLNTWIFLLWTWLYTVPMKK